MRERTGSWGIGACRWIWVACALLPLALVGCTQQAQNTPNEQVAGERQEGGQDSEVLKAVRDAGLPETFMFGGRTWKAHQLHRIDADEKAPATTEPSDKISPPGPAGAKTDSALNNGGFVPVADFQIQGHALYRKADADEAVTDNIYLKATMPAAATSDGGDTTAASAGPVFVEYDAAENVVEKMDLSQVLTAAGLPETVTHGGKTFKAREVQTYDPDVFDGLKKMSQKVHDRDGFMGDEKDELYLEGTLTNVPAEKTDDGKAATGTGDTATTTVSPGPVFIKYEAD